ncbi:MAG: hypothetical protein HS120_10555 [Burkholderiales bacterium]|nr:hypothetical protein [Burkholderiales bacterium]
MIEKGVKIPVNPENAEKQITGLFMDGRACLLLGISEQRSALSFLR